MSISDIIKDSFLESMSTVTVLNILEAMVLSILFGLLIYYIYKKSYRGVLFSTGFAITLVGMTIITCAVTLAISTNVVISLGMVGALSIVRFRTAVKDAMDLLFLFFAISVGIILGAQAYLLAVIVTVCMVLVLLLLSRRMNNRSVYILILQYKGEDTADAVKRALYGMRYEIKSKTLRGELFEMAIELQVKNKNLAFAEDLRAIQGVEALTLVQYNGEYHG